MPKADDGQSVAEDWQGGWANMRTTLKQHKLVIVDNEKTTRDALQAIFIRKGWEVAAVTTLAEGLTLLKGYSPDWVIVASMLPDGDDVAVIRKVQSAKRRTRVAILMPSDDSARFSQILGFSPDIRLTRPVTPEEVYRMCDTGEGHLATRD